MLHRLSRRNKTDRVQVLDGVDHSKSKQYSPPASLSSSSNNLPATHLERRLKTTQSNRTQDYVAHFRKKPSQTAAWQFVCSQPPKERVETRKRVKKI